MTITRKLDIKFDFTPEDLAGEFCNMNSDEQARFFNFIDEIVEHDWDMGLCFQLQEVTDSEQLKASGRRVMSLIGEYSEKN